MNLFNESDGSIFVNEIKKWIGTPHRNAHKQLGVGVDCARLIEAGIEGAGYLIPGALNIGPNYTNDWYLYQNSENILLKNLNRIAVETNEEIQVGDILLYRIGRQVGHAAIFIGGGKVIHAINGFNVGVTDMDDDFFYDKKGGSRLAMRMRLDKGKITGVNLNWAS